MQIKGPIKTDTDKSKSAYQKLQEIVLAEGRKVKLSMPFLADGFKSEKTPLQPDGITPVKVNEIGPVEIVKPVESKKYTEPELIKMNKKQQIEILEKFGISKIPLLEKDRIKKILEIQ